MTPTVRTTALMAVTLAIALPGAPARAAGQDTPREPARTTESVRALQRELDEIAVELAREAADLVEAREMARAAGDFVQGLAIEAGILAGRFAGGLAEGIVHDLALEARLLAQGGRRLREGRGPEVTETFSQRFQLGQDGTFELTNLAGDITVTGGGGTEVVIDGVKRVRNPDEAQGRAQLAAIEIEFIEQAGRLEVRIDYPNDRRLSGAVDFTVALPTGTNLRIRSVAGDVTLDGVAGELRAESISGDVTASGARHIDLLKSVSGDVTIRDAQLEDSGVAATVDGDLLVSGLRGEALEFASVSGDIHLEAIETDRLDAQSVSGDITYEGTLTRNGRYDLTTHAGRIRLALTGDTGFDVNASTFSGDVRSDYPLTLVGRGRDRPFGQSVRGSFGDASAVLELRTFSGTISIEEQ